MAAAVLQNLPVSDLLVMAAAVSDYRPKTVSGDKIKKSGGEIFLPLEQTEDILKAAARVKGSRTHVGFSVETREEIPASRRKLEEEHLDMIATNNPLEPGAGFVGDTNIITLLRRGHEPERWPLMSKQEVAEKLLTAILEWENEARIQP